jgi:para-nitrobenzyl esterase
MRKALVAALIVIASQSGLTALPAMAETAAATPLSVETTDLGTLLDNAGAKAVLAKHIPDLIANEQISMARGMTLKQLQGYAGDVLTEEKLAAIQADLNKLPK